MSTMRVKLIGFNAADLPVFDEASKRAGNDRACNVRCMIGNGRRVRHDIVIFSEQVPASHRRTRKPSQVVRVQGRPTAEVIEALRTAIVQLIDYCAAQN